MRSRKAAPATVDALRAMLAGLRHRAVPLLGFAIGARRSELAALALAEVTEVDEGLLVTVRYGGQRCQLALAVSAIAASPTPRTGPTGNAPDPDGQRGPLQDWQSRGVGRVRGHPPA